MKTKRSLTDAPVAVLAAFIATCLALPVQAASFPDEPLTTGLVAEPNIMFILDDSGSMVWRYIYNPTIPSVSYDYDGRTYQSRGTGNGVNEDNSYQAHAFYSNGDWYSDASYPLSGAQGLYDRSYVTNTVYYNPATDYTAWRKADGTRYTAGLNYDAVLRDTDLGTTGAGTLNLSSFYATYFVPKSSTADTSRATGYYRYQIQYGNAVRRCEYTYTKSGDWAWRNCVDATPTGRSVADEKKNFAAWYSYHRTRMKAAKAGASEVFQGLDNGYRVGFRTIHPERTQYVLDIPVSQDDGRFESQNRASWFDKLFAVEGNSGTPLRSALDSAGKYFSDTSATGPYGPQSGSAQLACRQNFTILTTDGYWNSDAGFNVGDQDGNPGLKIVSPDPDPKSYTYQPILPFKDSGQSNTLADVAMKYWKTDLHTLPNIVPTTPSDEAFWQHMVTFGISIGLKGTLDQASVTKVVADGGPRKGGKAVAWPTVGDDRIENIDDLLHAAVNGHGEFVSASDPKAFAEGLKGALGAVAAARASGSSVATTSASFESETLLFKAAYVTGIWSGEVEALDITNKSLPPGSKWKASKNISFTGRTVLTSGSGTKLVAFPTSAQEALLERDASSPVPVSGVDNANYIKGDQSRETIAENRLRVRTSLLGDIIHSSPVYSKDSQTVFVGANDGMLHAFNAADGKERFAFVPKGLNFSKLATLSLPAYKHSYFVDGPLVLTSAGRTPGKNYLVGTLGRGGKGLFALDVTTPTSTAMKSDGLRWDYTGSTDADMGYMLGEPLIVKANTGDNVVIASNGIDSTNGSATLFIYNLTSGAEVKRITVDAGPGNGLMAPRSWDNDGDGDIDFVFAGDLKGNLWKFDLSSATTSNWKSAYGSPLFVATDALGNRQPITGGVSIAKEPVSGRLWVLFGTGRYISVEDADISKSTTQSIYGVIDGAAINAVGAARATKLQQRIIEIAIGSDTVQRKRAFEAYSALPDGKSGWFIDFDRPAADKGERVVSRPQVYGRALLFPSIIPGSTNPCKPGGRGYLNALDAFTGTSASLDGGSGSFFDNGGDGKHDNDNITGDGKTLPVGSIDLGVGMPTSPTVVDDRYYVGGSEDKVGSGALHPPGGAQQRVFWREIFRE